MAEVTGSALLRLAIFDMDGVIFEGSNFWLDLHRLYHTEVAGQALADRFLATDYDQLAEAVGNQLWKGKRAADYIELAAARRYQPGVEDLFAFLRDEALHTAILSSGPDLLALRAQRELGVDLVRANGLEIDDGILTGNVTIAVADAEKARIGFEIIELFGIGPEEVVFVGDSESDVEIAKQVGLSVAYDSRSETLRGVCDFILEYGELTKLIEIIRTASGAIGQG